MTLVVVRLAKGEVFLGSLSDRLVVHRVAVVGERVVQVEAQGARAAFQSEERALGFLELVVRQPGGCGADAGLALDLREFEDLALGLGFGPGREVLADALAVEPAGDAENDIPGGIREI